MGTLDTMVLGKFHFLKTIGTRLKTWLLRIKRYVFTIQNRFDGAETCVAVLYLTSPRFTKIPHPLPHAFCAEVSSSPGHIDARSVELPPPLDFPAGAEEVLSGTNQVWKTVICRQSVSWSSGWWFEPLWKIWKSIGMIIPNIWENKKCSKPPTRHLFESNKNVVKNEGKHGRPQMPSSTNSPKPSGLEGHDQCRKSGTVCWSTLLFPESYIWSGTPLG